MHAAVDQPAAERLDASIELMVVGMSVAGGDPLRLVSQSRASELYCPKCGKAQPVREKLLLVLPSGELHEYLCARCATSLGQREVTGPPLGVAINPPRRPVRRRKLPRT